jgi:hypothetical protein
MNAHTASSLAASRTGRILLHLICFLRRPTHVRWHWNGILRELLEPLEIARGSNQ